MLEAVSEGQVVLNAFAPHLVEKDRAYLLYFSFKGKVADHKRKDAKLNLAEGQNVVDDVPLGQATKFDRGEALQVFVHCGGVRQMRTIIINHKRTLKQKVLRGNEQFAANKTV